MPKIEKTYTERLELRLSPEDITRLAELSDGLKISRAGVIRAAVGQFYGNWCAEMFDRQERINKDKP